MPIKTMKLVLTQKKAYFFYATDCETEKTIKLSFQDKEKFNLTCGTIIEAEVEVTGFNEANMHYEFIKLLNESIPDGREKVIEEYNKYKSGDTYDSTIVLKTGQPFIKNGNKVQYLYFK